MLFGRRHTPRALYAHFIRTGDDHPELRSLGMDIRLSEMVELTRHSPQVLGRGADGKGITALTTDPSGVILSWPVSGDGWFFHGALMGPEIFMAYAGRMAFSPLAEVTIVNENYEELTSFTALADDPGAFPHRGGLPHPDELLGLRVSALAMTATVEPHAPEPAKEPMDWEVLTANTRWTLEPRRPHASPHKVTNTQRCTVAITCRCTSAELRTNQLTRKQFWYVLTECVVPLVIALPSDIDPPPTPGATIAGDFVMTASTMGLVDIFEYQNESADQDTTDHQTSSPDPELEAGTTTPHEPMTHPRPSQRPHALSPSLWSDVIAQASTLDALDLPAGHQVLGTALRFNGWASDKRLDNVGRLWLQLAEQFPHTGLWPICSHSQDLRDPRTAPFALSWANNDPRVARDPVNWLRTNYPDIWPWYERELEARCGWVRQHGDYPQVIGVPPHLAPWEEPEGAGYLELVPCRRPSDAAAVLMDQRWDPHGKQMGLFVGCLRRWEENYGLVPAELGGDHAVFMLGRKPLASNGIPRPDDAQQTAQDLCALAMVMSPADWQICTPSGDYTGPQLFEPPLDTLVASNRWEWLWE